MPLYLASASGPSRRGRWWLLLFLAAAGVSCCGAYRFYQLPSVARRRRELARLQRALISVSNTASAFAEAACLVSADLNRFLRSDSEPVPTSLRQLSKLALSEDFSTSISKACEAVTAGIIRGISSAATSFEKTGSSESESQASSSTFSGAGSGFATAAVVSFASNLASTYLEVRGRSDEDRFPRWILRFWDDARCRELVVDSIARAVSASVAMYLGRTMTTNSREEFLANSKREAKEKDILDPVCNGAVANSMPPQQVEKGGGDGLLSGVIFSTLAIPSNRRLLVDVTGRVAVETLRSFLDFLQWKLSAGARRGVDVIHERAMEMVSFASAKSMIAVAVCFALCMQISIGSRFMVV